MSDQDSPNGPFSATPKKETVRITLPPKPADVPLVKRETVRIDIGNKAETMKVDLPPPPAAPKKESTRIAPLISGSSAGIPSAPKAFVPPPSAPKMPGGLPTPPRAPGLPSAPGLGAKPALPLKPAPPGSVAAVPASATPPAPAPVVPVAAPAPLAPAGAVKLPPGAIKPSAPAAVDAPVISKAAPKKETSRISITPEPKKMPQATIKLQQTQPLAQAPAAAIRTAGPATLSGSAAEDGMVTILSAAAAVVSLAAVVLAYLAYSA